MGTKKEQENKDFHLIDLWEHKWNANIFLMDADQGQDTISSGEQLIL